MSRSRVLNLESSFLNRGSAPSEIYAIYVLSTCWSRHLGQQLMETLEKALDSRAGFTLWVLANNDRAIRFYQKLGYRSDGSSKNCEIGGVTVTEMRLRK